MTAKRQEALDPAPRPDGSHDQLPADPEYDNTQLGVSAEGISTVAKLAGRLRRELRAEGFSKAETYNLCEKWLEIALGKVDDDDEE